MVALKLLLLNNFDKNKQTFTLYFVSCQPNKHSFYYITDKVITKKKMYLSSLTVLKKTIPVCLFFEILRRHFKLLRILNLIKFELSIAS